MQEGETIPMSSGASDWENRFPGAVAFVETFDTDEDVSESADILSFESLRKAFATIQSAETELAQTIPEIELSAEREPETPERPDYEIDAALDLEEEGGQNIEPSSTVGVRLETIIEAMLFVGNRENRPLDAEQVAEKLRNVSAEEVEQAVARLNEHYQERNCPYTIILERNGYRIVLRFEFESVRANFYGKTRETRLSQQAIDTLAVVAYRQPITAEEIQNLRQQSCSTVLTQLVRRNLLSISREVQDKKSVVRYHTTPRFLELFHIKSLDDIPSVNEWDYR
jgi:segregation and condensation protein B